MSETPEEEINRLKYALWTIVANTEPSAFKRIPHDGLSSYEVLARDIKECAQSAIGDWRPGEIREGKQG